MTAYEEVLTHTSTKWAPWYVIPADHKWFTRLAVAEIILDAMKGLKLRYPEISKAERAELAAVRAKLARSK
jgi:hypothetical protein